MHRCCLRGVITAGSAWHTARLVEADFRSDLDQLTDLSKEVFNNAGLSYALLQRANLHGANLLRCCLYSTSFCEADLRKADLRGCDLRNSKLEEALREGALLPEGVKP